MMRCLMMFALCGSPLMAGPLFEDMSPRLPAHSYTGGWEHFVGGGVALFDCDGDTLPDMFAAGGTTPAKLIRNRGGFRFGQGQLPEIVGTTGAYPVDIDADGYQDLFVLRVGPNVVLRGGPDCAFTDVTDDWGIPQTDQWSTAFSAWWEEGATRPVMAIGNYVDRSNPDGPFEACDTNQILRPAGDGENAGYTAQILSPGYCALSILAARDAWSSWSLRISNDRHYYVSGGHEQLWDIDTQRFRGADDGWPKVSLWGMGIASRDVTGDGRDEVMMTSMGDQLLQIARAGGGYDAAPFSIGTYAQRPYTGGDGRPSTGWHAEFADVDNNGRADLFIAKGNVDQMPGMATKDPNNLLMQQRDGTFAEQGMQAGIASLSRARGAGLADFDGDGRLDLVVMNRRAPMEVYRNVTARTGNWLRIDLRQTGDNPDALGALVKVTAAGVTQSVQKVVGGGHGGGQALPLHVGVGEATYADVLVTWPDGETVALSLEAGQAHMIRK